MSEETNAPETNDGTWSGLKKTLIGTISTAVLAGGGWVTTTLFNGGGDEKESEPTQHVAPAAQPVINVNLENNNTNQQKQSGGTNTIIKERVIEKESPSRGESSSRSESPKPKKKEGDEFKKEEPQW
jgi:hypothetical protein